MRASMRTLFIERQELEVAYGNLVVISDKHAMKASAIPEMLSLADILQARFGEFVPFVVGLGDTLSPSEVASVPGAFEMAWETGLYGLPFEAFLSLPDADALLTNFRVFNGVWGVASAYTEDAPGSLESWFEKLFLDEGLVTCWWCIPDETLLFYQD